MTVRHLENSVTYIKIHLLTQRRCYNCGSEDCADSNCTKTSKCSNCEGQHKVSSSNCPVFKKLKNQRQINRILQTSSSDNQNENSFH